jgi:hypothetical protein
MLDKSGIQIIRLETFSINVMNIFIVKIYDQPIFTRNYTYMLFQLYIPVLFIILTKLYVSWSHRLLHAVAIPTQKIKREDRKIYTTILRLQVVACLHLVLPPINLHHSFLAHTI